MKKIIILICFMVFNQIYGMEEKELTNTNWLRSRVATMLSIPAPEVTSNEYLYLVKVPIPPFNLKDMTFNGIIMSGGNEPLDPSAPGLLIKDRFSNKDFFIRTSKEEINPFDITIQQEINHLLVAVPHNKQKTFKLALQSLKVRIFTDNNNTLYLENESSNNVPSISQITCIEIIGIDTTTETSS